MLLMSLLCSIGTEQPGPMAHHPGMWKSITFGHTGTKKLVDMEERMFYTKLASTEERGGVHNEYYKRYYIFFKKNSRKH
jgi:hypothetical protein